jgi:hypothetical protein
LAANTQSKGAEKARPGGGGAAGLLARTAAGSKITCALCKSLLNAKAPRAQLMEHVDSKHAKVKDAFTACFPEWKEDA